MNTKDTISIIGARVNNLKNIDLEIPRDSLVVVTGLSGSGKSSLAFDTIYAEGQRRYMETLSAYARQFMGTMERPDVDKIEGLSPVVAIEQKTTNKNPRSTVGTVTEINDFLRLLYARASRAISPATGEEMVHYSDAQIIELINEHYAGHKVALLAPVVKGRKGHYHELFEGFLKKGFLYARVDGEVVEMTSGMKLDRYKTHTIELVVDRLIVGESGEERLSKSLKEAMKQGKGTILVYDYSGDAARYFSRHLMCPTTGLSFDEPAPHTFSFNSPQGACPHCGGLGEEAVFDRDKLFPDGNMSIADGGIAPLYKLRTSWFLAVMTALGHRYNFTIEDPLNSLSEEALTAIINGDAEPLPISGLHGVSGTRMIAWQGISQYIESNSEEGTRGTGAKWIGQFIEYKPCKVCGGTRLKEESLYFRVAGKNIAEVSEMSIEQLREWIATVPDQMNNKERAIAHEILKEISDRLGFLCDVGLGYLSLSRASRSLSGGESQRIRLATQVGSKLVNVLYILDEPSIGLHQRDNRKLIRSLENLRDEGNSVIVVEHDEDMMRSADWIIDMGPLAGRKGGYVVAEGDFATVAAAQGSLTADYLSGRKRIEVPAGRRKGSGKVLTIRGARGNNLKDVTVSLPLEMMVCVTGVSGSGKSSLINETLRPFLSRKFYNSFDRMLPFEAIEGVENIDKVVVVDQSPIGRSPRSNPATYSNVFSDIRKLFEKTPDAQVRGFTASRFSFNVKGGRCEECKGAGVQTIEMNFLPDVYVTCKACGGHRYNRQTLEVRYKGKNIDEVLSMTINQAVEFFESVPNIYTKLKAIQDVGLGYLKLGQSCTTLSGGESQRIKLASELSKRDTGRTLYIFDEPTTGLHFEDINQLLGVFQKLVDRGNSVVIIEHNLDVIKCADWIVDMGPEGGAAGGRVVAEGTPEDVARVAESYTGQFLKECLTSND